MLPFGRRSFLRLTAAGLAGGYAGLVKSAPPLPTYTKALTLGAGKEWRFNPLLIDINGDGHLDLVATARLVQPALHMWLGDGKGTFTPVKSTWTDVGYGALATGDINGDGFPDIVTASHFGAVQTLLSDGKGGFTEKILREEDGFVAAQLADLNGDGYLDLILVGFRKIGIQIYLGNGAGDWTLHKTLPVPRPGPTMPGRALVVGDLNNDGHLDLVAAFSAGGFTFITAMGREASLVGWRLFGQPSRHLNRWPWVTSTKMATLMLSSTEPSGARISPTGPTCISGTPAVGGKRRRPG